MKPLVAVMMCLPGLALAQSRVPLTATPPSTPEARSTQLPAPQAPVQTLLAVRRIYVAPLTGGAPADSLRELIISGLDSTRLFVLTDDPERSDAVLKGAADDHAFVDSLDADKSVSSRGNLGGYAASSKFTKLGGYGGQSADDRDSHHIRERKHEAYATVRLCSRDGDVLWSTTQESAGSKFRGASADVALKISRQILADYEAARKAPAR